MLKKSVIHIFLVSFLAVALTSCKSSKTTRVTSAEYSGYTSANRGKTSGKKLAAPSEALLSEARSWLGVPYKYGGNDRGGVDCSGFVLHVYMNALDIPLPRTSREQHKYCKSTAKSSLIPGDLIFFATDKDKERISHVGIFVGDNQMIHASTSKGVIISDITSSYYARNYAGSGMIERYHTMLGDTPVKSDRKDKKKKAPASKEEPVIHISPLESPTGYSLTPVDGLPVPKQDNEKVTKPKSDNKPTSSQKTTAVTTITTATATSSPVTSEPTVEDARAAVLKSIKEKEL